VVATLLLTCTADDLVVKGSEWMVCSRYREAPEAGALMLQQGGNAFDTTVAGLAALGIVDPLMFGLGAEVFALAYSAEENKVISINGGGTISKIAPINWYVKHSENSLKSPLLTGLIPGAFDAWITALDKWGTMTLKEVLAPAIRLAGGWVVTDTMEKTLKNTNIKRKLLSSPSSKEIYYKEDGSPYLAGEIMINDDLANTMKILGAAEKAGTTVCPCMGDNNRHQAMVLARNYFYVISIAKKFGDFCKSNGAFLAYSDLASFQGRITTSDLNHALIELPAHINYRGYDIYTCPSANQGPAELEALNIIEKFDLAFLEHNTAQSIHLMAESMNLAYADREKYLSDFNFIKIPLNGLLSKEYAEQRKSLVNPNKRMVEWPYGNPFPFDKPEYIYDGKSLPRYPEPAFVHIMYDKPYLPTVSKVAPISKDIITETAKGVEEDIIKYENSYACAMDKWGNLVYATTSLTSPFGSGVVIKPLGFPINSGMDYFHLEADHANALDPGKRPRSSLTPTIVCKDGKPYFACSAPTGDGEPQALSQLLVNIIDYGMNIREAIDAPMWRSYCLPASKAPFTANPGVLSVDKRVHPEILKKLEEMNWKVRVGKEFCNNPEFIIMIDQEQGTLKVAVTSNKASTVIAR